MNESQEGFDFVGESPDGGSTIGLLIYQIIRAENLLNGTPHEVFVHRGITKETR